MNALRDAAQSHCTLSAAGGEAGGAATPTPDRQARLEAYIRMLDRPEREEFQQRDAVVGALGLQPGDSVADVGAGSGYFTIPVAKAVGPSGVVWAVDVEQAMLDHIAARAARHHLPNVSLHLATPSDPGLPRGCFDTVLMVDVWHYVRHRTDYAMRLQAALAPGGRVVIIDYIPKPYEVRPWGPLPEQQLPQADVDADMRAAGLTPRTVHRFLTEQYFVEYALA